MENPEKTYKFLKTNQTIKKIVDDCIDKKEYWKALRLLNSLMRENSDTDTTKLAYKLHSRLFGFVGILDDYINLIVSNDLEAVVIGAKGLIEYANGVDEKAAKTYYEFVQNKLKNFVSGEDKKAFENLLGYENNESKIHFVPQKQKDLQIVEQIDSALDVGDYNAVKSLKTASGSEQTPIVHKMLAEADIFSGKLQNAEKELALVPDAEKDTYYFCLLLRVLYGKKKTEEFEDLAKRLTSQNINHAEEIVYICEALLDTCKYDEILEFVKKHEEKFEFYYPLHFVKAVAYLNLSNTEKAKESFTKTAIIWPKQVIAKEFAKAIEQKQTFKQKITARGKLPKNILKSVESTIDKQLLLSDIDFSKLSIGQMQDSLYWVEFFRNELLAEQYILRLTYCKNGIEAIKRSLLSFQNSDWLKMQCIKMLVFVGGNDFDVLFVKDNLLSKINLMLPKMLLSETEVYENWFASENINYQKFIHAYSSAFSILALETQAFENRLAEVADCCIKSVIELFDKKKSDKIDENYIIALLLYATCSNKLAFEFKAKKANVSKYSTISTAASEFEIDSDKLNEIVKQIF